MEKLVFNRLGLGIACAGLFVAVACGGSSSEDKPSSGGSGGAAGGGGASGS
ncbi:MAG: YgcG family protein, partial [Sorangiineae bacterium PRO1]|nr:YgcG family protein [Sorangiineae bacterium PRO1]